MRQRAKPERGKGKIVTKHRKANPPPVTRKRVNKYNNTKAMNKEQRDKIKIGTWNIRSMNGKEIEMIEEFKKTKLEVLDITETKKKGVGDRRTVEYRNRQKPKSRSKSRVHN
ncbi:hypothetical protein RI129_009640 [Pyrocoelia pectoralis]|uniref:Uncharacterized protein n=1 Tax=Pyrocoelia pectoralis TaxID=417401 RepID=A0AAN7ZJ49_9COLE